MVGDAPDIFAPGISYNAITNRVILGSRPLTVEHWQDLRRDCVISHVINVCETDDRVLLEQSEIFPAPDLSWRYLFNPTSDDHGAKPAIFFQTSLRFAMAELVKPGSVVYVHCQSGMDRSAATVFAILLAFGLMDLDAGFLIKRHRPEALWFYLDSAREAVAAGW